MTDAQKRLHTLLTDRAIAGLERGEQEEFEHLRAGAAVDPSYELAGAAIELALMGHATPMPVSLLGVILEQASHYWGYAEARPHDPTRGSRMQEPTGDFILGDEGDVLLPGDDPTPVQRLWEASPRFGFDESLESGVLESSLTDGRVDRGTAPDESQRGDIPRDLLRGKRSSRPHRTSKRTDRQAVLVEPREREPSTPKRREREPSTPRPREREPSTPKRREREASAPKRREREPSRPKQVEMHEPDPVASDSHISEPTTSGIEHGPVNESLFARVLPYASAIAALIMLLVAMWLYAHRHEPLDPAELGEQLAAADDKLVWEFVPRSDPAVGEGASGSVTWSGALQAGVVDVSGLAINDPAESQYQLWIVDKQREGPPVDGGVFDITSDPQQVRLDPKLVVGEPGAFLITVERPGGVVVSQQERVVMVGAGSLPP